MASRLKRVRDELLKSGLPVEDKTNGAALLLQLINACQVGGIETATADKLYELLPPLGEQFGSQDELQATITAMDALMKEKRR